MIQERMALSSDGVYCCNGRVRPVASTCFCLLIRFDQLPSGVSVAADLSMVWPQLPGRITERALQTTALSAPYSTTLGSYFWGRLLLPPWQFCEKLFITCFTTHCLLRGNSPLLDPCLTDSSLSYKIFFFGAKSKGLSKVWFISLNSTTQFSRTIHKQKHC